MVTSSRAHARTSRATERQSGVPPAQVDRASKHAAASQPDPKRGVSRCVYPSGRHAVRLGPGPPGSSEQPPGSDTQTITRWWTGLSVTCEYSGVARRDATKDQLTLVLDADPSVEPAVESPATKAGRTRGRPRKWESDAHRMRAYRERRSIELEEPNRLREELRDERRRASALRNEVERQRRRAERAERQMALAKMDRDAAQQEAEHDRELLSGVWKSLSDARQELAEERSARAKEAKSARAGAAELPSPPARPQTMASPRLTLPDRQAATPMRRCSSAGCLIPPTVRLRGGRGVEKWACPAHGDALQRTGRWTVIRPSGPQR